MLKVVPGAGGRELRLLLRTDRALAGASVEGVALPGFGGRPGAWRFRWSSAGEPVTLRFRADPGTRLVIDAVEVSEARIALPPRPATVIPWLGSDRTMLVTRGRWRL